MPYNVTLQELVQQVRAEIGTSVNPAQGQSELPRIQQYLRRTQERLWAEFAWPHMLVQDDETMLVGQRSYTFNTPIDFDRVTEAEILWGNFRQPVVYRIGRRELNAFDSNLDVRSDPVQKWQHYGDNQFEVWPIPASAGQVLTYRGTAKLRPLIANGDQCDLDSNLLVLFVAAEMLAKLKSPDAQAKQTIAQSHYRSLRANSSKDAMIIIGGGIKDDQLGPGMWPQDWVMRTGG